MLTKLGQHRGDHPVSREKLTLRQPGHSGLCSEAQQEKPATFSEFPKLSSLPNSLSASFPGPTSPPPPSSAR